jgi:hypothetical protein
MAKERTYTGESLVGPSFATELDLRVANGLSGRVGVGCCAVVVFHPHNNNQRRHKKKKKKNTKKKGEKNQPKKVCCPLA